MSIQPGRRGPAPPDPVSMCCPFSWTEPAIPPETWQTEIIHPELTRACKFTADDRKCLAVSAYAWAGATHGEHIFAPIQAEILGGDARQTLWRRDITTVCSLLKRARNPRYLMLKELIDAYADRLAGSLDRTANCRPRGPGLTAVVVISGTG
ncbi:hypothetical protein AB0K74_39120 [Streptomyces sp. NPDC056159]|uniref:hypothetical protein n=1 Tax=Streptomyces sp. NPDC056159 TaxID=3155537 RepID=UPI00342F4A02